MLVVESEKRKSIGVYRLEHVNANVNEETKRFIIVQVWESTRRKIGYGTKNVASLPDKRQTDVLAFPILATFYFLS